jgi:hypothetical protein
MGVFFHAKTYEGHTVRDLPQSTACSGARYVWNIFCFRVLSLIEALEFRICVRADGEFSA